MTPSSSGSRLSPLRYQFTPHRNQIDNDSASNQNSKSSSASNSASASASALTEMVEKHYIDKKESFLDDAWDIIHGSD